MALDPNDEILQDLLVSSREILEALDKQLVDDAARPSIQFAVAGNCWQPYVKNYVPHDNSQYNHLRFEEVWLDK